MGAGEEKKENHANKLSQAQDIQKDIKSGFFELHLRHLSFEKLVTVQDRAFFPVLDCHKNYISQNQGCKENLERGE